ncbi:MAG: hypothetical protein ACRDSL_13110 [Pseudonocardiaceae bacterium]
MHSTPAAGRDVVELLDLAVLMHAQTIRGWLYVVGAPLDLRWDAATLARQAARQRHKPAALGVAAWGSVIEMLASGAFSLARPAPTGHGTPVPPMPEYPRGSFASERYCW